MERKFSPHIWYTSSACGDTFKAIIDKINEMQDEIDQLKRDNNVFRIKLKMKSPYEIHNAYDCSKR